MGQGTGGALESFRDSKFPACFSITHQLLSSSEDLLHSTSQTYDLQAWKAETNHPQHLCTCYSHDHCLALWTAAPPGFMLP